MDYTMFKLEKGTFGLFAAQHMRGKLSSCQSVFTWLMFHADGDGDCFPSIPLLAEEAGCSPHTVIATLKGLEKEGLLSVTREIGRKNKYHINIPNQSKIDMGLKTDQSKIDMATSPKYSRLPVQNRHCNQNHKQKPLTKSISTDFENCWKAYPKRFGSNSKQETYKQWQNRIKEKETIENLLLATQHYARFAELTEKIGTEYVMQAQRFYGKRREYEQFINFDETKIPNKTTKKDDYDMICEEERKYLERQKLGGKNE